MNNKAIFESAKDAASIKDTNEMLKKILDVLATNNKSQEIVKTVFMRLSSRLGCLPSAVVSVRSRIS